MRISVEVAEGRLSQLIAAAAAGEDIVLSQGDVAVARIVAIPTGPFRIGILPRDALGRGPDFLEPMDERDLALWEGGRGSLSCSIRMPGLGA